MVIYWVPAMNRGRIRGISMVGGSTVMLDHSLISGLKYCLGSPCQDITLADVIHHDLTLFCIHDHQHTQPWHPLCSHCCTHDRYRHVRACDRYSARCRGCAAPNNRPDRPTSAHPPRWPPACVHGISGARWARSTSRPSRLSCWSTPRC